MEDRTESCNPPSSILHPPSSAASTSPPHHPTTSPLRILLTEGSSLSARHTLYALGRQHYIIDVCDPNPNFCLARYSRYVRRCYRCPPFGIDPVGYLRFLMSRLAAEHYDVLFPVHDQTYLLARFRHLFEGRVGLAVPEFAPVERVQSKAAFSQLLCELSLPQPVTTLVRFSRAGRGSPDPALKERAGRGSPDPALKRQELRAACTFPCYVKLAISTAGRGVWLVRNSEELAAVEQLLEKEGLLDGQHEILVQQPAPGALCVVQSVFQHGRLIAAHTYQALALGVGGSARARVSVSHPLVLEQIATLGRHLNWHGPMMIDYLYDPAAGPAYIDGSPRIGETMNATLSGVNLCELLVRIAMGEKVDSPPLPQVGVRSHSLMMSLLAAAERGASRRELVREMWGAWNSQGIYAQSQEDLTRVGEDWRSLLPAAWVTLQLLAKPASVNRIVRGTVENYALSAESRKKILELPDTTTGSPLVSVPQPY